MIATPAKSGVIPFNREGQNKEPLLSYLFVDLHKLLSVRNKVNIVFVIRKRIYDWAKRALIRNDDMIDDIDTDIRTRLGKHPRLYEVVK